MEWSPHVSDILHSSVILDITDFLMACQCTLVWPEEFCWFICMWVVYVQKLLFHTYENKDMINGLSNIK